jgi:hypothetical protein
MIRGDVRTRHGFLRTSSEMTRARDRLTRRIAGAVLAGLLGVPGAVLAAEPQPAPPYPAPPPASRPAPRRYYYPPPRVVAAPPPLSPVMRAVYAPFYVAGLVVRYGVYYAIVAPLEVFGRAVSYGAKGGVESPPPRREASE